MRNAACSGLRELGPMARAAAPTLTAQVRAGRVDGAGLTALAAVAGKDAVPDLLAAVDRGRPRPDDRKAVVDALADLADPGADAFMAGVLADRDRLDGLVPAALYFSRLSGESSRDRLRGCLGLLPRPGDDRHGPLSTCVSVAASVRAVAVEALGRHRDSEPFVRILRMLETDPSVRVRTATAAALGVYAGGRAVPALARALGQADEGFSAQGHTDGDLRRAAIRSLGRIGTAAALDALYDGLAGGRAAPQCMEFWCITRDPTHLVAFLRRYDARPLPPDLAAGLIRAGGEEKMTAAERATAEAAFVKAVNDPERYGPAADLTAAGRYVARTALMFYPGGFVRADFSFRPDGGGGYGHGYGVLYRKRGERWRPVGRAGGWVE